MSVGRRGAKGKEGTACVPWREGGAINTAGTPPEAGFIQQLPSHTDSRGSEHSNGATIADYSGVGCGRAANGVDCFEIIMLSDLIALKG